MALDFISPSMRAAGSDLTIAVSPLGLIELSDEEFEIHGPRLTRYANAAAFYLGHHWSFRRPPGEPQLTANYVATFADYLVNFTFSKSVMFKVDPMFTHITPALLDRIWNQDNRKDELLWGMGNLGAVYGDVFVKVAYEPPYVNDITGEPVGGRVRILPLNPSFCFPEWHPHDKDRLLRFKLKYRFWSCVDTATEALTKRGWVSYDDLSVDDEVMTLNPETNVIEWQHPSAVNMHYQYPGHMISWDSVGAVTTPNHRWLAEVQHGRGGTKRYDREIVRTEFALDGDKSALELRNGSGIVVGGGSYMFPEKKTWNDALVELAAWYITEGTDHYNQQNYHSIRISQSETVYPEKVARIRNLQKYFNELGMSFSEGKKKSNGVVEWYIGKGTKELLEEVAPAKRITPEFLLSLTREQAVIFHETLIDGDGYRGGKKNTIRWTQLDDDRKAGYQMLCAMLGIRSAIRANGEKVQERQSNRVEISGIKKSQRRVYTDDSTIWCPEVSNGVWMARREGQTFWTGNTSPEGTRIVNTYVEILTDQYIEEYINDELIDRRPNPLGFIPVVHIANKPVAASPWGLSDVNDIIPLNRTFNELATDILDILNYHVAPVTVITGAKAANLEMGANKMWALPQKDARIENLSGGAEGLGPALEFMSMIKLWMHELAGVPQTALGQEQQISNTSGVALSIQYMPTMMRYNLKVTQYGNGIRKISCIALKTLFLFEPECTQYDPMTMGIMQDNQSPVISPYDPQVYNIECIFPPPLPQDQLVVLNEIQAELMLGLESKEGALRKLGEQFPDEKLQELFQEQLNDTKMDGAKAILSSQINSMIAMMTGLIPEGAGTPVDGGQTSESKTKKPDGTTTTKTTDTQPQMGQQQGPLPSLPGLGDIGAAINGGAGQLLNDLVTQAYGTKLAQRRIPTANEDSPGYDK